MDLMHITKNNQYKDKPSPTQQSKQNKPKPRPTIHLSSTSNVKPPPTSEKQTFIEPEQSQQTTTPQIIIEDEQHEESQQTLPQVTEEVKAAPANEDSTSSASNSPREKPDINIPPPSSDGGGEATTSSIISTKTPAKDQIAVRNSQQQDTVAKKPPISQTSQAWKSSKKGLPSLNSNLDKGGDKLEDIDAEFQNEQRYEAEILAKYIAKHQMLNKGPGGAVFLPQLILNLQYTQYEVLRDVAEMVDMQVSWSETDDPEWDVYWLDSAINPQFLFKMQPFQRVNHFTGMHTLARKNLLARNLQAMQRKCPEEYDFFPPTWILPQDAKDFKVQFNNKKAKTFIVKPEASCQGKGIFLTRGFDWMQNTNEHFVAQRYLHKPYLISGLKFDLRIYVLVTGVNPLRAYITREGLARFATEKYQKPGPGNLTNMMMHLTNYAINKESMDFIFNRDPERDDVGHKRSLKAVLRSIDNRKHFLKEGETMVSSEEIWASIKDIILKTLLTAQPALAHAYKTAKPDDLENSLCFQILGFDIFLDKDSKPWLLEVNHTPSFTTDTPLDFRIKKNLIADTIKLLGLSMKRKLRYQAQKKVEQQRRMLTGYNTKTRISAEEKEAIREKKQALKDKQERENMGQFEHLYPPDPRADEEKVQRYETILQKSREVWEESQVSGTSFKKSTKDVREISQKQLDFLKQNSFHHQAKRDAQNNNQNGSTSALGMNEGVGKNVAGAFVGHAMGGGFKASLPHKILEKQLLEQQSKQLNAAVGLRINSKMHMTQQINTGGLEMIEEVEQLNMSGEGNESQGYLMEGESESPNKMIYGFPPSIPVRQQHQHMQNYGKYVLENDQNFFETDNIEDPLAGLIVSRNLEIVKDPARYTEFNNNTLPLVQNLHDSKSAQSSYNGSPLKHHSRTTIHQQNLTANFGTTSHGAGKFYQVLDHVGNIPMSEKTLVVQQYRQKLEQNVSGKHILTPFQQTLINFQRAQITRQMNAASEYTPQPSALYMPNPNLSYQYKQSFLQSQFNNKNKGVPITSVIPMNSQQYYDQLKKQYKEKMLILDNTKHVVPPPVVAANNIYQQQQHQIQQQIAAGATILPPANGSTKKLPNMLGNQNALVQSIQSQYNQLTNPSSTGGFTNGSLSSTKISLAPALPPQHLSAQKAPKGKPYFTLSVEKSHPQHSLNKSNSKRKLAVFGNNMASTTSEMTPTSDKHFSQHGSQSMSQPNPVIKQALIQLDDPNLMMHGLCINRLVAQNNNNPSRTVGTPMKQAGSHNTSKQTAATTLNNIDSIESL